MKAINFMIINNSITSNAVIFFSILALDARKETKAIKLFNFTSLMFALMFVLTFVQVLKLYITHMD